MLEKAHRAYYRVWQFSQAVRAAVTPDESGLVSSLLSEPEQELFEAMPLVDQRHCLDVFYSLKRRSCDDKAVLKAALLHDAGKSYNGRTMRLSERVAVVLLDAVWTRIVVLLASADPNSSRYGFYLHANHERLGAVLLSRAGSEPDVITLVSEHERPVLDRRSLLLHQADEEN
jgi:hypothetical protein